MKQALLALAFVACEQAPLIPPLPKASAHTLHSARTGLQLERSFSLADEAVVLSIDDDVRIELRGPGRFLVRGEQLLVGEGMASVDVAAQAVRSGQHGFSVATPGGQLEIPYAARLVVRAQVAAELAVVSGEVRAGTLPLGANARVCFGAEGARVIQEPGYATLEAALAGLPASRACTGSPALSQLERELGQQLDTFTRSRAEQDSMIARARANPPGPEGRAFVQELVASGQRTLAARTRALGLRAQLEAAQLGNASTPAQRALLARAAELEGPAN